ncbi:MAG: V-type ATPase subunit [Anaerolineaceae bacterium]
MSTFDYGNTRLRARLSRLLTKEMLEEMTRTDNIDGFLSSLIKSPYKSSIEKALTISSGIQSVHTFLEIESENLFKDFQSFYEGSAWDQVRLLFAFHDFLNIHTIVRGVLGDVAQNEIQDLLTRSGKIPFRILQDLSRSQSFSILISKMIAFHIPYTDVLLKNQTILSSLQGAQIELLLEKVFYDEVFIKNGLFLNQSSFMKEYFSMHVDQDNIICALRITQTPQIITDNKINIRECFIDNGTISKSMFISVIAEKDIEKAIECFSGTPYYSCLQDGLQEFQRTGLLTEFEEKLRKMLLEKGSKYPFEDPIGVGVPIGYFIRKTNEMQNVWWIAKGIQLGFDSADIIEHLEVLV